VLILGAVLLVIAAVAVFLAIRQQRKWHLMAATETLTCAQLREQADLVGELGGTGGFRKVCEVVGNAQPGPDGATAATISKVPCVWHRHEVHRRYDRYVSDGKGGRRRERRSELASRFASEAPFALADATGTILVGPQGASVDRPERVHKEHRPANSLASLTTMGVTLSLGSADGAVGYDTEEWAIRTDTPLYVLGEVTNDAGHLRIGKPEKGRMLISTRSEAELTASARRAQRIAMVVAVAAALGGVVSLVVALF
jgi:hypothetical protein